MTQSATALIADPLCREHLRGREHPERPERFDAVLGGLEASGLLDRLIPIAARDATVEDLLLCHAPEYVELVRNEAASGRRYLSTGDTEIGARSWDSALRAAGGAICAVDAVLAGSVANAFCVTRPPGHHAGRGRGMGFCLFNNAALAVRHARRRHGVERVLIVDWDVHHGNGTQDLFYADPSVFFFSTHQWPLYPGTGRTDETGEGAGEGTTMNRPFPAGSGRAEILGAFRESLIPAMENFRPELVIVSAGFDSREGDLLGELTLTDGDFTDMTRLVREIAERSAHGRIVSVLEGGYTLDGLSRAVAAHVAALL